MKSSATLPETMASCIVRHHNPDRSLELKRCLFSIAGQTLPNIEVLIMLQRFSSQQVREVEAIIEPLLSLRPDLSCKIINFRDDLAGDARTHLLNIGLKHATGTWVGFLDYDDTLYPEAYSLLANQMLSDHCGVAFASVRVVKCNLHDDFVYSTNAEDRVFKGRTLPELLQGNFCPLHSFLIDRNLIVDHGIDFDSELCWEEDYDFLLQVVAKIPSTFELIGTNIGDYYIKNDNSNSIGVSGIEGTMSQEQKSAYEVVRSRIELRRTITTLGPEVRHSLGVPLGNEYITIRRFLDQHLGKVCITPGGDQRV